MLVNPSPEVPTHPLICSKPGRLSGIKGRRKAGSEGQAWKGYCQVQSMPANISAIVLGSSVQHGRYALKPMLLFGFAKGRDCFQTNTKRKQIV